MPRRLQVKSKYQVFLLRSLFLLHLRKNSIAVFMSFKTVIFFVADFVSYSKDYNSKSQKKTSNHENDSPKNTKNNFSGSFFNFILLIISVKNFSCVIREPVRSVNLHEDKKSYANGSQSCQACPNDEDTVSVEILSRIEAITNYRSDQDDNHIKNVIQPSQAPCLDVLS